MVSIVDLIRYRPTQDAVSTVLGIGVELAVDGKGGGVYISKIHG